MACRNPARQTLLRQYHSRLAAGEDTRAPAFCTHLARFWGFGSFSKLELAKRRFTPTLDGSLFIYL
jgi:hypothetical protein